MFCLNCNKETKNPKYCSKSCFVSKNNSKRKKIKLSLKDKQNIKINNWITNKIEIKSVRHIFREYLLNKFNNQCSVCNWNKINPYSNRICLEVEHLDGNSSNNKIDNLTILCPNCHSLTKTYKALNKGNGRFNRLQRYKNGKSW